MFEHMQKAQINHMMKERRELIMLINTNILPFDMD